MALARDDRWLTDAQGRALAGAQVYYCTQPANTSVIPPSPLETIYSDLSSTPLAQPVITDGFGHGFAYLDDLVLYTLVFVHPLFGSNPVILPDQVINGAAAASPGFRPFAGIPNGTQDGVNKVFTLTNGGVNLPSNPTQATVWRNFPLVPPVGFTLSGITVTYTTAPLVGDSIYAQGFY
jgi:hypothetical protein